MVRSNFEKTACYKAVTPLNPGSGSGTGNRVQGFCRSTKIPDSPVKPGNDEKRRIIAAHEMIKGSAQLT
jgi:hypothetical protein